MKTIKIVLSIVGFALTTISFGQLVAQSNGSVLFYTVSFNTTNNQLEHHLEEYPERWTSGDQYDVPLAARTYFVPFESELVLESWMTTPFAESFYEEDLMVETWMTEPFAESLYEEALIFEPWMAEPFAESLYEEELAVEPWMTEPFVEIFYEEELVVEPWMLSAWI